MPDGSHAPAAAGSWYDERETQFNVEIHNLLDAAADAIDGDGSPVRCIDATRAAISVIDSRLIIERAHRLGTEDDTSGGNEIEDRIEAIRGEIFDVQAIVDVVRMSFDIAEDFSRHHALRGAYDQLDAIATRLESVGRSAASCESTVQLRSRRETRKARGGK
ncbi:hypothetical protein [Povalibacter sp.]|uniref:hypothetical protein n=1 Tax=Povalibacter sp. TaxID=1962978 RepID=UPI002F3F90BD